jgi:hypothetical protein
VSRPTLSPVLDRTDALKYSANAEGILSDVETVSVSPRYPSSMLVVYEGDSGSLSVSDTTLMMEESK